MPMDKVYLRPEKFYADRDVTLKIRGRPWLVLLIFHFVPSPQKYGSSYITKLRS